MNALPSKNLAAKILCVIMAIVLWLYVMNEQNPPLEASFTVPLEVKNLSGNYTLIDAPESVRVKVRGARSVIATLTGKDIAAYIDLKGVGEGRQQVKITAVVPQSVELVEVNPDKALLRIDTMTSRKVPVEVRYTGVPPEGATVGKAGAAPDTITVEGPRSSLDSIERAIVEVNISDHSGDFSGNYDVLIINKEGKELEDVTLNPARVTVTTQMIVTSKKMVEVKPNFTGELPPGMMIKQLSVNPPRIELQGSKELLDTVDSVTTEPIALGSDVRDFSREAKVVVKEGLTAVPSEVAVKFILAPNR